MPAERCLLLLVILMLFCEDGPAGATGEASGLPSPSEDNGVLTAADAWPTQNCSQSPSDALRADHFSLRAVVRDHVTRQPLAGALVDVYANRTLRSAARTGPGGEVLLWAPYSPGLRLTLLANMEGYVPNTLPWRTGRRPLTLTLLPQNQGNIWMFEDSLVITVKLPESASQPSVKFPKNLLMLSETTNSSSLTAYLTVPQPHLVADCVNCTPGIISTKSVSRDIDLRPVAAVSVRLYSGSEELQVRGPIHVRLPLDQSSRLRPSDTMPAWAFNVKTGAWEKQGLGVVKEVGDHMVWTYTASHLGYWIAAPLPTTNDYMWHKHSLEFLSANNFLLVGILISGATLVVVMGFLTVLVCHCRGSGRELARGRRRARFSKLTVAKKDQTTSTHMEEGLLFQAGDHGRATQHGVQCEPSSTPRHRANYNIYVDDPSIRSATPSYNLERNRGLQPQSHYVNGEEVARLREKSEQNRAGKKPDLFFQDKLVHIYNQPVAIIQAPELFSSQEQQGCKSATFPRNGGEYDPHADPALPKAAPHHHHSQSADSPLQPGPDEPRPLETPPQGQVPNPSLWSRYSNLLESSVSVPGTLNEAAGVGGAFSPGELQGVSERTLLELTRGGKSGSSHPRAWFVSLDGKPAAQVRHSIIELQGRHRAPSSNDTSLDSGVDMSEPQQSLRSAAGASSLPRRRRRGRNGEEQDPSSSESGTTATCTPEDPTLRDILDGGGGGAIPNIPEERDGPDTSGAPEDGGSRGTPPPRRLRKVREKGRTEKRGAKHVRDARPLPKPS